jgi:hypothetical protein
MDARPGQATPLTSSAPHPRKPAGSELDAFCDYMLASLPRSDQRRWGKLYVRALVEMPGRKSIPRMAERLATAAGRQALQQFINQSPWQWEPVRRRLAHELITAVNGQVWVIDELVFPKHGSSSIGVAKQFVPSMHRTLRCQLGLGLFLVGSAATAPVNWCLMLPQHSFDHCPSPIEAPGLHPDDDEMPRSRWDYAFALLDEVILDWALPTLPVILDARGLPELNILVTGLEARGLGYFVQVTAENLPSAIGDSTAAMPDPAASTGDGRLGARREIVRRQPSLGATPHSLWLTNLATRGQSELTVVANHRWRSRETLHQLQDLHGLQHFEGRSLRGWHHHVTLVSLAHAFRTLWTE